MSQGLNPIWAMFIPDINKGMRLIIIRRIKENLERPETNKNGRGTEWHLPKPRASSGPWVSIAKTYRDETK